MPRLDGACQPPALASPLRAALAYCLRPNHLRRTGTIALVVGIILISINQSDVILVGHADTGTWIRRALNFLVPFVVSNLGLLSGRAQASHGSSPR